MECAAHVAYPAGMDRIRVEIPKPWLSVADICDYMGVSTFVVTSILRSGELPAVKFGREWRISRDDFEVWINDQRGAGTEPLTIESEHVDLTGEDLRVDG